MSTKSNRHSVFSQLVDKASSNTLSPTVSKWSPNSKSLTDFEFTAQNQDNETYSHPQERKRSRAQSQFSRRKPSSKPTDNYVDTRRSTFFPDPPEHNPRTQDDLADRRSTFLSEPQQSNSRNLDDIDDRRSTFLSEHQHSNYGSQSSYSPLNRSPESEKRRRSTYKPERKSTFKSNKKFEKRLSSIENTLSRIESQRTASEPGIGPGGEGTSRQSPYNTGQNPYNTGSPAPPIGSAGLSSTGTPIVPLSNHGVSAAGSPTMVPFIRSPGYENDLRPPITNIQHILEPCGNCQPSNKENFNFGRRCSSVSNDNKSLASSQIGWIQEKLSNIGKMAISGCGPQKRSCGRFGKNTCYYLIIIVMLLYLMHWMVFVNPYPISRLFLGASKSVDSMKTAQNKVEYCQCSKENSFSDEKKSNTAENKKIQKKMRCTCRKGSIGHVGLEKTIENDVKKENGVKKESDMNCGFFF